MAGSKYDALPEVLKYCIRHGITADQLFGMVDQAARFSQGRCNRRYHDWLFELKGNCVVYITPFLEKRPVPTPGPNEFLVYEECEQCEGKGCRLCNGVGEVPVIRHQPKNQNW